YNVEFGNGFAYYFGIDSIGKHILVSKIDLSNHHFVYQKSIGGTNGYFPSQFFGTYVPSSYYNFIVNNGDVFFSGVTTETDYPTTPGSYQLVYPLGANAAYFVTKLD